MYCVLMAGGVGTRFWPLSRAAMPKQILNLLDERSMLQMTYDRIKTLTSPDKILVITNVELKDIVSEQLPMLPEENIITEPFGRNTAPCIGLAGAIIQKRSKEDEMMVVLPADHLIENEEEFRNTIEAALSYTSKKKCLITIGVKPFFPETGYGYIQRGDKIFESGDKTVYKVKTFAEKPNLETAERFLKSGDFLWNSGMFIWSTELIMQEFAEYQADMFEGIQEIYNAVDSPQMAEVVEKVYSQIKSASIDYAIMEAAKNVCVLEADFKWNDVGSWDAAYLISDKDKNQNAVKAKEHCLINAANNYIYSKKKLVALVDVDDLVIVETEDALLITKRGQTQNVKNVVDDLRRKKLMEYL